jgi:hypothetical protein
MVRKMTEYSAVDLNATSGGHAPTTTITQPWDTLGDIGTDGWCTGVSPYAARGCGMSGERLVQIGDPVSPCPMGM